jgi:hypothetical protein
MAESKAKDLDATTERDKAQVQEKVDEENAQGFRGTNPDPTPNHHYTFEGAAKGLPTPETDPEMAAKAGRPRERVITTVPTSKER